MKESAYNIWIRRNGDMHVFNGVSGALLRLPESEYEALQDFLRQDQEKATPQCSAKLLQDMVLGRMLVPDEADELAMLAKRYEVSRHDTSHFALTLVTSLGCNFDCPYCFEAKHPSIMDEEVQKLVIDVVEDQLPRISSLRVSWYGGEPLVGKNALLAMSDSFIARCNAAGVSYKADITTNGYLLTRENCRQLRDHHVKGAQVCLDGPPEVHDRMRPLAGGGSSFWRIVENLQHAVEYLDIVVRVNLSHENFTHVEELFGILKSRGLENKLSVYPGKIIPAKSNLLSPSASYQPACFKSREFANVEREFLATAAKYELASPALPQPVGTPCTAVRANELVVGSRGELYKCWEDVGNNLEVIGNIRNYEDHNGRLNKWLKYDPFSDKECRTCIALPVCMGGCAHHAMREHLYEDRCDTFRYSYLEQTAAYIDGRDQGRAEGHQPD